MSDGRTEAMRGTYFGNKNEIKRNEKHWEYSDTKVKKQELPDAKKHQIISFVKSSIRILGYCFIPFSLVTATVLLILSEIVGIIEELV
jgi:hypothetical protein